MTNKNQSAIERFEKRFVVRAGTKRIKRVGHYATRSSEIPSAAYWDNVKDFLSKELSLAEQRGREEAIEGIESLALDTEEIIYESIDILKSNDIDDASYIENEKNKLMKQFSQTIEALKKGNQTL